MKAEGETMDRWTGEVMKTDIIRKGKLVEESNRNETAFGSALRTVAMRRLLGCKGGKCVLHAGDVGYTIAVTPHQKQI